MPKPVANYLLISHRQRFCRPAAKALEKHANVELWDQRTPLEHFSSHIKLLDAKAKLGKKAAQSLRKEHLKILCHQEETDTCIKRLADDPLLNHGVGISNEGSWQEVVEISQRRLGQHAKGLHTYLAPATPIKHVRIASYGVHNPYLDELSLFAQKVRRIPDFHNLIVSCALELISNVIFKAIVKEPNGEAKYQQASKTGLISLSANEMFDLSYGCDEKYFALSVKDPFGRLAKDAIMHGLSRCARDKATMVREEKAGAGIGLYMVLHQVHRLDFFVDPQQSTEVVVCLAIDQPPQEADGRPRTLNFFIDKE